jgi:hypothetical protein
MKQGFYRVAIVVRIVASVVVPVASIAGLARPAMAQDTREHCTALRDVNSLATTHRAKEEFSGTGAVVSYVHQRGRHCRTRP